MRNYDRINALPPDRIAEKHAHIVGGGIAGLSTAAFLVTDASMPADHVTIYESLPLMGGSMDAAGNAKSGYTSRGERELEAYMECLWYLCSKVPSLQTPGLTILDETHQANLREPINSHFRLMEKQGRLYDYSGPLMSAYDAKRMLELLLTPESDLEMKTPADWFGPQFTNSVFWLCWSTMLAFRDYHSLIEVRRYVARFMMHDHGMTHLQGILHTEFNEYDSLIKPIHVWLESLGVRFRAGTTVTDIATHNRAADTLATELTLSDASGVRRLALTSDDLVFFTNGSLTQNATMGDTHVAPTLDRETANRGCFTVWEHLAARDPKFGRPAAFISDIEKSNWMSFFPTITGDPTFYEYLEKKTGDKEGTCGAITILDSMHRREGRFHQENHARVHGGGDIRRAPLPLRTRRQDPGYSGSHHGNNFHDALHYEPVHAAQDQRPPQGHSRRLRQSCVHRAVCRVAGRCGLYCGDIGPYGDDGRLGSYWIEQADDPDVRARVRSTSHRCFP